MEFTTYMTPQARGREQGIREGERGRERERGRVIENWEEREGKVNGEGRGIVG